MTVYVTYVTYIRYIKKGHKPWEAVIILLINANFNKENNENVMKFIRTTNEQATITFTSTWTRRGILAYNAPTSPNLATKEPCSIDKY